MDDTDTDEWGMSAAARGLIRGPMATLVVGEIAQHRGLVRYKELRALGAPSISIADAIGRHGLVKVSRGLYTGENVEAWRRSPMAQVFAKSPRCIAALRTATWLWRLGKRSKTPPLWFAMPSTDHSPKLNFEVKWLRWSGARLEHGIDQGRLDGLYVWVTSPARTVADFFAHRRRVSPGEPSEVLAAYRASTYWNESKLLEAAAVCRVAKFVKTALRFG